MNYQIRYLLSPFLLVLTLLSSGCQIDRAQREAAADKAFGLGHFSNACFTYKQLLEQQPQDQDLRRKYRVAQVAAMLKQGQEAFFEDRVGEAERWFRRVLQLVPRQKQAIKWLQRTAEKQSREMATQARRAFDLEKTDLARRQAEQALELNPDNKKAAELLGKIEELRQSLAARGLELFDRGMKKLMLAMEREELSYSLYLLEAAKKKLGENFTRDELITEIKRRIVRDYVGEAKRQFLAGSYPGALIDLRYLETLDPANSEVKELKQRVLWELEADKGAWQARSLLARGEVAKAKQALLTAARTSRERSGLFKAGLEQVREVELNLDYKGALDQEARGDYSEAIDRLKQILERSPSFKDAQPRVRSLQENLEEAERHFALARKAEREGRAQQAMQHLQEVFAIFPWYPDAIIMKGRLEKVLRSGKKPR